LWKYRWRFLLGILFIILSNYFRILTPQITGYVINSVETELHDSLGARQPGPLAGRRVGPVRREFEMAKKDTAHYDVLVRRVIRSMDQSHQSFSHKVAICGITLLILAIIGGFFMFLMRQTIIVMSRHIEFDQKNEIYLHYQ